VGSVLADEVDLYRIFRVHPTAMALLTANLEFIDANDEFLKASHRSLDELVGRYAFAVLPKTPDEHGLPKWTALEEAVVSGRRETFRLTRYDIEDPDHQGTYEERYWSTSVVPVRGRDGQVEAFEFSAREVTPIIDQFRSLQTAPG
jgi:PAS domain-containing protein